MFIASSPPEDGTAHLRTAHVQTATTSSSKEIAAFNPDDGTGGFHSRKIMAALRGIMRRR
jgi:hypothetical protein